MSEPGFRVTAIADLERSGRFWRPIRRPLGIAAFGVNAWAADGPGDAVIGEHDETRTGHEELYAVLSGRVRFTLDGVEIDAPVGTLVFVRDPEVRRAAIAAEPDTTVLAVGAEPGAAFAPQAWEAWAGIAPLYEAGEYDRAAEAAKAALEQHTEEPVLLYNLACCESLAGRGDDAVEHLRRALELDEDLRSLAETDADLDPIRGRADFPGRRAS